MSCLGTRLKILALTCKAIDIWLSKPRVTRRGASGPGRPSGMPQEYTWITAREGGAFRRWQYFLYLNTWR